MTMGFRQLPASYITSGPFVGTFPIDGLFIVGNPAGPRAEIGTNGGGESGIRLYSDATTETVTMDSTTGAATFRGTLIVGIPTSPPHPYIEATVDGGFPVIYLFDGDHTEPVEILTANFVDATTAGLQLHVGDGLPHEGFFDFAADYHRWRYANQVVGTFSWLRLGPDSLGAITKIVNLYAETAASRALEINFDLTTATPDGTAGRIWTQGEIYVNQLIADANYPSRVVDGKVVAASTTTAGIPAADTAIGGANAQDVYLEANYAYRAIVHVDQRANAGGNRLDYKLWGGSVGTGTQLGGTNRRFVTNTGGVNFEGCPPLIFEWRQGVTTTYTNVNLSATRAVGAGVVDVQTNLAYSMVIEKIGSASKIGGL